MRHGYNLKRNFGHGSTGPAKLFTAPNLHALALHGVLGCVLERWRQGRALVGPRRKFFATLGFLAEWFCFHNWTALFEIVARKRPLSADHWAAAFASS